MEVSSLKTLADHKPCGERPALSVTVFVFNDGTIAFEPGQTCEYTCGDDPALVELPRTIEGVRRVLLAALLELERP